MRVRTSGGQPGRPRDSGIDARALEVARAHLAEHGYEAMSLAAVAAEAGTTRQALYRRWATKAELATAAIAALARADVPVPSADPFDDLVAELASFRRGIERPDGISMVGTMLLRSTDPSLVALFREHVVAPRRRRLRAILERMRQAGLVAGDADIDVVLTQLTGSWYAYALAGERPPRDWARRVAEAACRSLGGGSPGVSARAARRGETAPGSGR